MNRKACEESSRRDVIWGTVLGFSGRALGKHEVSIGQLFFGLWFSRGSSWIWSRIASYWAAKIHVLGKYMFNKRDWIRLWTDSKKSEEGNQYRTIRYRFELLFTNCNREHIPLHLVVVLQAEHAFNCSLFFFVEDPTMIRITLFQCESSVPLSCNATAVNTEHVNLSNVLSLCFEFSHTSCSIVISLLSRRGLVYYALFARTE